MNALSHTPRGLTAWQRTVKRSVDLFAASIGLTLATPVIAVAWVLAARDTGQGGFFRQERIGRDGQPFRIWKLRTMRSVVGVASTATAADDPRITPLGRTLRAYKIDELPQLFNVLRGEMSLVGPRPDVPGFADRLEGDDRIVLSVRPGITGPATLAFRDEERLLAEQPDPEAYSRDVIYPRKVQLNRAYVEDYTLLTDLKCLFHTVRRVVR